MKQKAEIIGDQYKFLSLNEIKDICGIYIPVNRPKSRVLITSVGSFFIDSISGLSVFREDFWKDDKFFMTNETIVLTFES